VKICARLGSPFSASSAAVSGEASFSAHSSSISASV